MHAYLLVLALVACFVGVEMLAAFFTPERKAARTKAAWDKAFDDAPADAGAQFDALWDARTWVPVVAGPWLSHEPQFATPAAVAEVLTGAEFVETSPYLTPAEIAFHDAQEARTNELLAASRAERAAHEAAQDAVIEWDEPAVHEALNEVAVKLAYDTPSQAARKAARETTKAARKERNRRVAADMRAANVPINADTWHRALAGELPALKPVVSPASGRPSKHNSPAQNAVVAARRGKTTTRGTEPRPTCGGYKRVHGWDDTLAEACTRKARKDSAFCCDQHAERAPRVNAAKALKAATHAAHGGDWMTCPCSGCSFTRDH